MSFAVVGAIVGTVASVAAPIVAGVAGVASVVGSVASGILGAGAGLAGGAAAAVGGTISALTGGAAAPVTVGQQMASIAAPAYYETAALGVPAAAGGVSGGLSTILTGVQAGVGIYGQLAELEIAEGMSETEKIAAQTKLMEAEAAKIYAAAPRVAPSAGLPTLSTQPVYVTPAPAAAAPNYLLYAGLALLAFILMRRK